MLSRKRVKMINLTPRELMIVGLALLTQSYGSSQPVIELVTGTAVHHNESIWVMLFPLLVFVLSRFHPKPSGDEDTGVYIFLGIAMTIICEGVYAPRSTMNAALWRYIGLLVYVYGIHNRWVEEKEAFGVIVPEALPANKRADPRYVLDA